MKENGAERKKQGPYLNNLRAWFTTDLRAQKGNIESEREHSLA